MPTKDRTRIQHMIDAVQEAEEFCKDSSFEEFCNDRKLANATVRSLEIIGEAASQLSREFRNKYPDIEWRDIIAMRNVLIHAYFDIDYEVVWKAVKEDLPPLVLKLNELLEGEHN